jgi:hypothetical protein
VAGAGRSMWWVPPPWFEKGGLQMAFHFQGMDGIGSAGSFEILGNITLGYTFEDEMEV